MTLFLLAALTAAQFETFPNVTLKNDKLAVIVYTPDTVKGLYRSTRFDHAGVLTVKFGTHTVFGRWKDTHNPENNDDIVGPVDEFGFTEPLGYSAAKVGETFLKIGVGELVKPKEDNYGFWHKYVVKTWGVWETKSTQDSITFEQSLTLKNGLGYKYTKTVALSPAGAGFVLRRTLTNTGTRTLDTDTYNHNFLNSELGLVDASKSLTFPFDVKIGNPRERFTEATKVEGKRVAVTKTLDRGSLQADLLGFGPTKEHHGFVWADTNAGVSVAMEGDVPLEKFGLWGTARALCPEPFVRITLKPGESKSWSSAYSFTFLK